MKVYGNTEIKKYKEEQVSLKKVIDELSAKLKQNKVFILS